MFRWFVLILALVAAPARAETYRLEIGHATFDPGTGPVRKIAVNGQSPGPLLTFTEGEEAVIEVVNTLKTPTSVHWHGALLPGLMDGAPGFNGFKAIPSGGSFTYRFKVRQTGTYWYHAHSGGQEQDGLFGPLVLQPRGAKPKTPEEVVVLSDFTREASRTVLSNLKKDGGYYASATGGRPTLSDLLRDAGAWARMRMSPHDLSDVGGYRFLINGRPPEDPARVAVKPGEALRLRIVNASAMTFYDLRVPGLAFTVVQADGQDVAPVTVDEFRIAPAETYDVLVTPKDDRAYAFVAEPIDRSGMAMMVLASKPGETPEKPAPRPRAVLTMADMGHGGHGDHAGHGGGWSDTGAPRGTRVLSYEDLKSKAPAKDTRAPGREIVLSLDGSMERYIWTLNGKTYDDAPPLRLKKNERVRLTLVNKTMMAHPMHLHGMFVQLDNGQPVSRLPRKHTVTVPPGKTVSVLLTADEAGEWPFHCHLLYHMLSGMMRRVEVGAEAEEAPMETPAEDAHAHHH